MMQTLTTETCMTEPLNIISLGAGVQSSTMALMAAHGEITPMPDAAVFADTQAEPRSVYEWLKWLIPRLPFPVYVVTHGSLEAVSTRVRTSKKGNKYTNGTIPAFMQLPDRVKPGILQRQCTGDFKINVIQRQVRKIRERRAVVQWVGISRDEAHRMKPAKPKYITNRWPLIELGMTRNDCLDWMRAKGYPEPPRSSCVFCPYHNDFEWMKLQRDEPQEFARAVRYEQQLQAAIAATRLTGKAYLHRSCVPIEEIDFNAPSDQQSLFGDECAGVCGV